jgi:hypothetical protein
VLTKIRSQEAAIWSNDRTLIRPQKTMARSILTPPQADTGAAIDPIDHDHHVGVGEGYATRCASSLQCREQCIVKKPLDIGRFEIQRRSAPVQPYTE